MKLPSHAIVLAISLVMLCLAHDGYAQTKSENTAAVTGKVTIKGKPASGIVVGMRLSRPEEFSSTYKAKTDQEGVYRITKVAGGSYVVAPVAPTLVMTEATIGPQGQSVIVGEGETIDDINFDLVPGGVITGKVVDSTGHPLIEERVTLLPADINQRRSFSLAGMSTDDRGIYRIFGLPAGKYKVTVGDPRFNPGSRRRIAVQTFYPDVTDPAKAGIVEVTQGSEATKIDITVSDTPSGFSVAGRVVDADSGAPVANVFIQLTRIEVLDANSTRGSSEYLNVRSDAQGQFKLTNVRAGKYDVNIYPPEDSDVRAEAPLRFDVIDQDVSGLVIKTMRGATMAGTVVFEGGKDNSAPMTSQMWIMAYGRAEGNAGITWSRSTLIKPDRTFFLGGLGAGIVNFNVETGMGGGKFTLSRIEREGVVQTNGIQVANGEHISGVRLVMTFSSGIIRGTVRVENGPLPPGGRMVVQVTKAGDQMALSRGAEVDARGRFLIEGLAAGSYELRAMAYSPDWQQQRRRPAMSVKQIVNVVEGGTAEVTLTIDPNAPPIP